MHLLGIRFSKSYLGLGMEKVPDPGVMETSERDNSSTHGK